MSLGKILEKFGVKKAKASGPMEPIRQKPAGSNAQSKAVEKAMNAAHKATKVYGTNKK